MTAVYIVIHEDRHIDVDAYPFTDKQQAITYAQKLARTNAAYPDRIKWREPLNKDMIDGGWVYYVDYSSEFDSVRVIERELDATP